MKIVCIDREMPGRCTDYRNITIGNVYDAIYDPNDPTNSTEMYYTIIDDVGDEASYHKNNFEVLSILKYRDIQIDKIL